MNYYSQLESSGSKIPELDIMPNILVVDDEPLVCWTLKTSLNKAGYHVLTAYSAEEAIRLIDSKKFDLIITDMKLPNADGFTVVSRAQYKSADTHVIMISAFGDAIARLKAKEMAIDYFIDKPFNLVELKILIEQIIKGKVNG